MQQNTTKIRKKRLARKRRRTAIRVVLFSLILVGGIHFIKVAAGDGLHDIGSLAWKEADVPAGYVEQADASLVKPQKRTEDDVKRTIKKLAKTEKAYKEIYQNYDAYPEELLSALCNNPEMLSYVQGYPDALPEASGGFTKEEKKEKLPLLIQWDKRWGYAPYGESSVALSGCAPTCLSMVVLALTGNTKATPDQIAAYAAGEGYYQAGTGTAWSLLTEGCEHFGIHGNEISLDEGVIRSHLEKGEPIICSMGPGDFTCAGHFIVLAGETDGKIMVNDPNSRERSKVLWDYETLKPQIKNLWAFSR